MFRARERGMSFWPFAVSLLLLIAFIVMWLGVSTERDEARKAATTADAQRKQALEDRDEYVKKFQTASKAIGFLNGTTTDPTEIDKQLKEYGPKLVEAMKITFPAVRYQQVEGGGQIEKTDAGVVTVAYLTDAELSDNPTVQAFLAKFETAAKRMKIDIDRAFAATDAAVTEKAAVTASDASTIKDKEKRIGELTGEKSAVEAQMREKETELNEKVAQLTQQKEQKEGELEQARKQASENEAKLIAQNNEKEGQIRSLVQRDAPALSEGPDGEVVIADNGVAIVNRGKKHWLMPGTLFDVWGLAKGGAKYKKGSIKITSCDDETSRGAIIEESARDPITKGDLVQSLVYSPNRKLHFAFVGDMKKMGRTQAEAVLTKLGAAVDTKVSAETNYLVVGVPASGVDSLDDTEAVKTAKDLGIRMITEEQLASFTRY